VTNISLFCVVYIIKSRFCNWFRCLV